MAMNSFMMKNSTSLLSSSRCTQNFMHRSFLQSHFIHKISRFSSAIARNHFSKTQLPSHANDSIIPFTCDANNHFSSVSNLSPFRSSQATPFNEALKDESDGVDKRVVSRSVLNLISIFTIFSLLCLPGEAFAFSLFGESRMDKDPIEPFTIYGSVFKKYVIEKIEEGKIVGRKKGFTASACLNVLDQSRETPELQAVPPALKVNIIGDPYCAKGEGQSREESCESPCQLACGATIDRHLVDIKRDSGYSMDAEDRKKALKSCTQSCMNECTKAGKSSSFVLPLRFFSR